MSQPPENKAAGANASKPPPLAEALPDTAEKQVQGLIPARRRAAIEPASAEMNAALRQANLLRVRSKFNEAKLELQQALEREPSSAAGHEMLGDMLVQLFDPEQALASYRRAQSCGAGATVEAKIGRLLLDSDPDQSDLSDETLVRGGGPVPIIASALIPGLGLALSGDMRSAAIAFAGWVVTLFVMFALPPTHRLLDDILSGNGMAQSSDSSLGTVLLIALGLGNFGFWLYSLVATMRVAKPLGKDE